MQELLGYPDYDNEDGAGGNFNYKYVYLMGNYLKHTPNDMNTSYSS